MKTKFNGILTLFIALVVQVGFAQVRVISGTVSDETGGLPGVNVIKKGTTQGVETDFDGKYTIKVKTGDVLEFSFVGMKTAVRKVGGSNVINVLLKSDNLLEEVVIKGAMGIEKTPDQVTSSQQVVTGESLKKAGTPNVVQALVGQVSGLQITKSGTGVNGSSSVKLRASTSITGGSSALVVIDGSISSLGVLRQIPPELIESTNIIKGAQGAALYGSDGSNGVIIVTTKSSSKSDKMKISISSIVNFDQIAHLPERQLKYGQGWNSGDGTNKTKVENGAWGPSYDDPMYKGKVVAYGLPLYDYNKDGKIEINTSDAEETEDDKASVRRLYAPIEGNNIGDFFKTGVTVNNTVSIDAGGRDKSVLFSLGHRKTDFVVQDDMSKRLTALIKGNYRVGKWKLSTGANYINTNTSQTSSIYDDLVESSPDAPITSYRDYPDLAYGWSIYAKNPYWYIKHNRYNDKSNFISFNGSLEYDVNDNITLKYLGNLRNSSYSSLNYKDDWLNNTPSYNIGDDAPNITSFLNKSNSNSRNYYGDFIASFDYDLTENIGFGSVLGFNYQDSEYNVTSAGGSNLIVPGLYTIYNLKRPSKPTSLSNYQSSSNSYAAFVNVDFSYKDYLFLNLTGRNEWSSVLPKSNNSFFYPSAGVSFIPTKAFDIANDFLSRMKVALSWTKVGNARGISAYEVNPTASIGGGFPYLESGPTEGLLSFASPTSITNKDIKPEFVTSREATVELGFFKNRVNLTSSYYKQKTTDLITYQSTSSASGISRNKINIGEMKTSGFELDLNLVPIRTENFKWSINTSYSTNKSIVTKVTDQTDEVVLNDWGSVGRFAKVGEEFPLLKAKTYQRHEGKIIVDKSSGNPLATVKPVNVGRTTPKHIFNFGTNVRYKGFELSAVMDYRTGHYFYSSTASIMSFNGTLPVTASTDRYQGGQVLPNSVYKDSNGNYVDNTTVKTGGDTYGTVARYYQKQYRNVADHFVFDASAFKVRQVSLTYTLKGSGKNFEAITFGAHARNPFRIFAEGNLNFSDPEAAGSSGFSGTGKYPSLKTYGVSLNIKF